MSEMLIFHDKELKIQWANDAACRSVDLSCEQIIGKYCYEVWQNDKSPCNNCPLLEVIKTGEICKANMKNDQGRVFQVRGYPVFDSKAQIIGLLEYKEDITDRIRLEEKLQSQNTALLHSEKIIKEKDELLTNIIQFLPDATFAVNKEGIIIAWNRAMETLSHKSAHDMVGSTDLSIISRIYTDTHPPLFTLLPAQNERNLSKYPSVKINGNTIESEFFSDSYMKSGSFIWIISAPIYNSSGEIIGYIESIRDISDRKKAEELASRQEKEQELYRVNEELHAVVEELTATEEELRTKYEENLITQQELQASEEKFRSLIEFSLESILIIDMQGTILFANQAIADLIELKDISSITGRNVMEFIAPESHHDVMRDFSQVHQGIDGFISEYQVRTARGNLIYVESVGKCITYQGKNADLLSIHDITTRKKNEKELRYQNEVINTAYNELSLVEEDLRNNYNELKNKEQKLRESENRFKVIFSIVPDPIILTRISDGKIIDCNHALIELVGLTYENIIGKSTLDFCVWKNETDRQKFLDELSNKGTIDKKELLWQNSKKEDINILFSSRIIEINKEKIILSVGFDYTHIKKAEDLIRESEEMFRNPVENSPVGIFLYQDGFFRYSNKYLAMMFGYSRDELLKFLDGRWTGLFLMPLLIFCVSEKTYIESIQINHQNPTLKYRE
jgi:PAS domain S-box-containing protein